MISNESQLQKTVVASVKNQGGEALPTQGAYIAGLPDMLIRFDDKLFMIELKHLGNRTGKESYYSVPVSKIQEFTQRRFKPCAAVLVGVIMYSNYYLYRVTVPSIAGARTLLATRDDPNVMLTNTKEFDIKCLLLAK